MSDSRRNVVVFDLGGVLVDWNPRHLYRRLFDDPSKMERFLAEVCTPVWNLAQDAGRSWAEATAILRDRHPEQAALIDAYHLRWPEMIAGDIPGTVAILEALHAGGTPLYALTNWSAETFPVAEARFGFLRLFRGVIVSGKERLVKPDPAIYRLLAERFGLAPRHCVYVDDSAPNAEAATRLGMHGIRFTTPEALAGELHALGFAV